MLLRTVKHPEDVLKMAVYTVGFDVGGKVEVQERTAVLGELIIQPVLVHKYASEYG